MSTIGCKNLHMCELKDAKAKTYDTEVRAFDDVKTIDVTPSTYEAKNVYNDGVGEIITGTNNVEVAINVADLTPEQMAWLFGAKKNSDGTFTFTDKDKAKEVAVMFESLKGDQVNSRYTVLYRGKFKLPKESFKTKPEKEPTFSERQIVGTFVTLPSGEYKNQVDSDDETVTTVIGKWYTKPHFPAE